MNLLPSDTSNPHAAFIQNGQADHLMLDPYQTINAGAPLNTIFEVVQNAPEGTTVGLVSGRDRAFLQKSLDVSGGLIDFDRPVGAVDMQAWLAANK